MITTISILTMQGKVFIIAIQETDHIYQSKIMLTKDSQQYGLDKKKCREKNILKY